MTDRIEPFKERRVYLVLRDRITGGRLAPGERLPGEPALAAEHGVARVTVRRALDRLAGEGLIARRPGAGTFVREAAVAKPIVADLANVVSHLVEMGRRTDVRLLCVAYGPAPASIATALGIAAGAETQRAVRVRLIDGAPFSHLTTHVPRSVAQGYAEADLANQPLLALLERSGVVAERAAQGVSAALAGPEVAAALDLDVGAPLLSLTRTVFDRSGRGVEHLQALYRPDRYALQMDLVRTGEGTARSWRPMALAPPAIRTRRRKLDATRRRSA